MGLVVYTDQATEAEVEGLVTVLREALASL